MLRHQGPVPSGADDSASSQREDRRIGGRLSRIGSPDSQVVVEFFGALGRVGGAEQFLRLANAAVHHVRHPTDRVDAAVSAAVISAGAKALHRILVGEGRQADVELLEVVLAGRRAGRFVRRARPAAGSPSGCR